MKKINARASWSEMSEKTVVFMLRFSLRLKRKISLEMATCEC